ncbi:MAG: sugar ABC transporter substrate-binding protein [Anaerolineae bacterium]|nr:sugar ABC transporter substrate-binding protein [Anaerolineae bacterium]
MNKKINYLQSVSIAIALLSACATPTPTAKPQPAADAIGGKVSLYVSADPIENKAYTDIVAAFKKTHPTAEVELINVPNGSDYRKRLAADFAAGSPADIFFLNYQRYAPYAAKNQLEPLGDHIARSRVIQESDFYEPALKPLRWNGKLTCLPVNISSSVIYYNKSLFASIGAAEPSKDWTWDDMVRTAQRFSNLKVDGQRVFGFGGEVSLFRAAPYIWSNGGELVDNPDKPSALALDTPAARAAIQKWVELQTTLGVAPTAVDDKAEDPTTRFINGRLAMFMDSRRVTPTFRDSIGSKFDWDVAPLPRYTTPTAILHSEAVCMAANSKNKPAAWALIETLVGPQGQTILAEIGRSVPSLKSVAMSRSFITPGAKPANSQVWLENIPKLRYAPVAVNWPDTETLINKELEGVYYGRQSLDDALKNLPKSLQ